MRLSAIFLGLLLATGSAWAEPYRFIRKTTMVCGPKKVQVVISLGHFEQKDYVEISTDGTGRYVSVLHNYQFSTFDRQTYYHTPTQAGAQTWAAYEKVGNLAIHTFYGIGMDDVTRNEKLIVNLDTMKFESKGFLLPQKGICWVDK